MPYEHQVEMNSAKAIGCIANESPHRQIIVDAGALPYLVQILKRHRSGQYSLALAGVLMSAANAISHLASENDTIKNNVRDEGAIPVLVELLKHIDPLVQCAAAASLQTVTFENVANKNQLVECGAIPALIVLMSSVNPAIHYTAVSFVNDLVDSSLHHKEIVLAAGALHPVIRLLSSECLKTQKEATLLIWHFAESGSDCKRLIAQCGGLLRLIKMLRSPYVKFKGIALLALARLAEDPGNQTGIVLCGGVSPLLKFLESTDAESQHNAAYAIYCLAENKDNIADLVSFGAFQKLQDGKFANEAIRECVAGALKRFEKNIHRPVLRYLLFMMHSRDKHIQREVALFLAHLCSPEDHKDIFIDHGGLMLLLELFESTDKRHQRSSSMALSRLASKANSISPMKEEVPSSPISQVYSSEQYLNNPMMSDVTFLIEGEKFYAHRVCLVASSDAFRAMLNGGYREREANDIKIPNISWDIFELMMRYIYTGSVQVTNVERAQDLLRAADQYLLKGLKRLCEDAIAQNISVENVVALFGFSEEFNASCLRQACILFVLENFDKLYLRPWYRQLVKRIMPETRNYFLKVLVRPCAH